MRDSKADTQQLYLREDVVLHFPAERALRTAFALKGETYRDVPGRHTLRVRLGDRYYFVKLHEGVGWAEVVKNWLQFKRPVVGARNEFDACQALARAGIRAPRVAAFGVSRGSMAAQRSFVLSDELAGYTSLEDVTAEWPAMGVNAQRQQRVLYAVARFARTFHRHGFIHRDFYLCHLLAEDTALAAERVQLAVLDLHRARQFARIPQRWLKRDLAALLFSSLDLGLSPRHWLRFIRIYANRPLREELAERGDFWAAVLKRAQALYREGLRKQVVLGHYQP